MDDLDRLFRYLVQRLAKAEPARLRTPFQISELYQTLLPYRTHKQDLGFDAIEDYEMAILRLLAGERGYASVEPEDVQEVLAREAEAVNPNPGVFREFAAVTVILNVHPVRAVLDEHAAYAPPGHRDAPPRALEPEPAIPDSPPEAEPEPEREPEPPPTPAPIPAVTPRPPTPEASAVAPRPVPPGAPRPLVFEPIDPDERCAHCDEVLPKDRRVVFCPFCGRRAGELRCVACGERLEPEWRFCLRCGSAMDG